MITDADVLEKAADMLESGEIDWCQRVAFQYQRGLINPDPVAACSAGAVALAANRLGGSSVSTVAAAQLAAREAWGQELTRWNDHPDRTKEEVINFFKQTAKALRNQDTPT